MIKYGYKITVFVAPLQNGLEGEDVTADGTGFGARSRAELEHERQRRQGA